MLSTLRPSRVINTVPPSDHGKLVTLIADSSKGQNGQMLREIYYAFIHSHVLYVVEIYANTKPTVRVMSL